MSMGVQEDPEGDWSDAVPILSEESSASMVSVPVCLPCSNPLILAYQPALSRTSILRTQW